MSVTLERMRRAVAEHREAHAPAPRPRLLPPIEQILRGEWRDTPHGQAFIRDEWYPLDHMHGSMPLSAPLEARAHGLASLLGVDRPPEAASLAFFDIETTGLSGGTGTYIVLAGLGSYQDGAFRLRQYFLADVGQERAMLALLAADLERFDGIVTYNGRAFDVPCVETRMALARLRSPARDMAHFDLLHPVRRLFKHRMRGCRLAEAERRLLRIDRPEDTPGWLVPQLYFDYVRAGRAAPLRGVFHHNAEDVLSLTGVLATLARLVSTDDLDPDDAAAAARWWEAAGAPARAAELYRRALPWLEGGPDWAWAALRHAALCKRAGARDEAAPLWRALWAEGDRAAGLELAKHHEHHDRDLLAAREVTARLLAGAADGREALALRLARIERKIASRVQRAARQNVRTA